MESLKNISGLKFSLLLILFIILTSCETRTEKSQFENIIIDKNLSSNLFDSQEFILNPLTLKTEHVYDNVPDSTMYVVKSNAIVNKDSSRLMRFAELKQLDSDTLKLRIHETNPMYSQNFIITINGDKFNTEFNYNASGPPIKPKIKRLKQKLIIKSVPTQLGDTIYGRFYFKGVCESGCKGNIEIEGDFKVEL
ncbi:hypothetical protein [Winogradskyella ouciana]|uniref:hypothetical protein n=1 Tax=Winogradskyella ouciana TaxID=2608631 RepID=UPI003D2D3843